MSFSSVADLLDPSRTVVLLLNLAVLLLPLQAALATAIRLRDPRPPASVWMCLGAVTLLYLVWLLPVGQSAETELQQLRNLVVLGLYAWVLWDWSRTVRNCGFSRPDLAVVALVIAMLGLFLTAVFTGI